MASKTIKGGLKSYVVDDSKNTYTLGKNEFLHYGGEFQFPETPEDPDEPLSVDLSMGYGIYEDLASGSDFKNNTYNIDGKLTGLFGGIATYGDGTRITIGKTADVNAQLGIGSITDLGDLGGLTFGTIFAGGDKSKITIANGAEIGGLVGVTVTGKGASVTNSGEMDNAIVGMMAGSFMTSSEPGGSTLTTTKLTNNGSIEAGVGIVGLSRDNQILTNGKKGEIEGLVGMVGGLIPTGEMPEEFGKLKMQNSGDIIAAIGMLGIYSPNMTLTNAKGAEIIAGGIGIAALTTSSEGAPEEMDFSIKINNAGSISVAISVDLDDLMEDLGGGLVGLMTAAILGGAGDETVVNTGKIVGHVVLSEGDDTFTMKAGSLKGDVFLGGGDDTFAFTGGAIKGKVHGDVGDDTYIIAKSLPKIVEIEGNGVDTVRSGVSYKLGAYLEDLVLTGKGNINGTGNDLDNELTGNSGNNKLDGGAGLDTFFFSTKGGKDTIIDFNVADDMLDLSRWKGVTEAFFVRKAEEKNGDVWITLGKDTLVIADHTIVDLDTANIAFATV